MKAQSELSITNLLALVKTEYRKFRKNTVVQLLLGTFILFAPLVILLGKRLFKYAPPPFPSPLSLMELPMVWDYQGYVNQHLIYVLLGYLVIYTVTNEIANKTMRQNIITGYTKREYFLAKLSTIVVISLFATALYYLSCIVIGVIHTDGVELSLLMDNSWLGLRYFLCCLGFMTFALFVALLVRRGGLAIFLYFGYIVVIEQMLRGLFIYITKDPEASRWFPMNVYEDLLPNPMMKLSGMFKMFDRDVNLILPYGQTMIASTFLIVIFTSLAWFIFKRRDV